MMKVTVLRSPMGAYLTIIDEGAKRPGLVSIGTTLSREEARRIGAELMNAANNFDRRVGDRRRSS